LSVRDWSTPVKALSVHGPPSQQAVPELTGGTMTKTIDTLEEDMNAELLSRGGWDASITEYFLSSIRGLVDSRFENPVERTPTLRMSNMGKPCKRQLWYSIHAPDEGEGIPASGHLKFFYGDLIESFVLSLARAAGHDVRGEQDELEIAGIRGHRDAVIDGFTVDVKSASPYSFSKFQSGELRDNDPFGYISQLSSYVAAGHEADDTVDPKTGYFLVVNKVTGDICLDGYTFTDEELNHEPDFERTKELIANLERVPDRGFEPEDDGYKNSKTKLFVKNGNKLLGVNCSYCEYKRKCYPNLRTFMYKTGTGYRPKFFTHVAKEPKVSEVTE
jgi:hypothetical protein